MQFAWTLAPIVDNPVLGRPRLWAYIFHRGPPKSNDPFHLVCLQFPCENSTMSHPPPSFNLEIATIDDVSAMVSLWFAAFTQAEIKRLFPDTPAMREWHEQWHRGDMETKDFQTYVKVVDNAEKDEQGKSRLIAFGKWDLATPEERGRRFPVWCTDSPSEECQGLIDRLEGERERVMENVRHYCMKISLEGRYGVGSSC